jgi:hypothetical protein
MQMDRDQAANLRPSFLLIADRVFSREKGELMTHEEFVRVAGSLAEQGEVAPMDKSRDQDQGKGAVEQDQKNQGGNTSMSGQLGHREQDAELKNADSDLSG